MTSPTSDKNSTKEISTNQSNALDRFIASLKEEELDDSLSGSIDRQPDAVNETKLARHSLKQHNIHNFKKMVSAPQVSNGMHQPNVISRFIASLGEEVNGSSSAVPVQRRAAEVNTQVAFKSDESFRKLKEQMRTSNLITNNGVLQLLPKLIEKPVEETVTTTKKVGRSSWVPPVRIPHFLQRNTAQEDESSGIGQSIWDKKRTINVTTSKRMVLGGRRASMGFVCPPPRESRNNSDPVSTSANK